MNTNTQLNFQENNLELYGAEYIVPNQMVSGYIHVLYSVVTIFLMHIILRKRKETLELNVYFIAVLFMFAASATYHLSEPLSQIRNIFHRLDHLGISVVFIALIFQLSALFCRAKKCRHMTSIFIIFLVIATTVKLVFFNLFLGWNGLLYFLAIFSVGVFYIVIAIKHDGIRKTVFLWGGITLLLITGFAERMQFPNIFPGIVGPHEVLHVVAGISLYSVGVYFFNSNKEQAEY